VSSVLVQMHLDGIHVDQAGCAAALEQAQQELEVLDAAIALTRKCNLFSEKDVYWLFQNRGIGLPDGIGDYYRLDEDDLEELASDYNSLLAEQILRWRKLTRDLVFLEAGSKTERLHPIWRLTRTSTGRITASNPPVQNLDKKRYRRFLILADGCVLIKADWKACQARILAHLSQDPALIKLFNEGQDFHAETAQMFGLASRDEAKPINFGMIFGQGAQALAREVTASWKEQGRPGRVDEVQTQQYIDTFFDTHKGILPYFEDEYEKLTGPEVSKRVLKNPVTGRIRRFRRRKSDKLMREMKATLLQQVESHLLKISLVRLSGEIRRRLLAARIVACIHDSIWIEAPLNEQADVREIMERVMTTAMRLSVPLFVDFD
jgi:DNA polymerase I